MENKEFNYVNGFVWYTTVNGTRNAIMVNEGDYKNVDELKKEFDSYVNDSRSGVGQDAENREGLFDFICDLFHIEKSVKKNTKTFTKGFYRLYTRSGNVAKRQLEIKAIDVSRDFAKISLDGGSSKTVKIWHSRGEESIIINKMYSAILPEDCISK